MTNETTASQPKSIGDDAQFQELLVEYWCTTSSDCKINLIAYLDSKLSAPVAQASATIQAAPGRDRIAGISREECAALRTDEVADRLRADAAGGMACNVFVLDRAADLLLAATIQELVMVAETVGVERQALIDLRELHISTLRTPTHFNAYTDIIDKALNTAAPMVADPAGVANKQLLENIEELPLAATVKAVPSEALQLAFSREDWGIIFDGVMLEIDRSQKRKESNAASNSDKRVEQGKSILAAIRKVCAAPLADKTGGGE